MLPTKFEWNEGGKEAFLIGNFSGYEWDKKFPMEFDEATGIFSVLLFLVKGTYEFKFIIDGKTRISKNYKISITDKGDECNLLDNSIELLKMGKSETDESNKSNISPTDKNISPPKVTTLHYEKDENEPTTIQNYSQIPKDKNLKDSHHHSKEHHSNKERHGHKEVLQRKTNKTKEEKKTGKVPYDSIFPNKNKLAPTAPTIPQVYSSIFSIDSLNDKTLEGEIYSAKKYQIKNYFSEYNCDSYRKINIPYHVNINHLIIKCEQYDNFFAINSTIRVGRKFCTLIFCNPYDKNSSSVHENYANLRVNKESKAVKRRNFRLDSLPDDL